MDVQTRVRKSVFACAGAATKQPSPSSRNRSFRNTKKQASMVISLTSLLSNLCHNNYIGISYLLIAFMLFAIVVFFLFTMNPLLRPTAFESAVMLWLKMFLLHALVTYFVFSFVANASPVTFATSSTGINARAPEPFGRGTHHMECSTPLWESECYQRYSNMCELGGLPGYGEAQSICDEDGCGCVLNTKRSLTFSDYGHGEVEPEAVVATRAAQELWGPAKGELVCSIPDWESQCYQEYNWTCETLGYIPGPSMASEVCGWDGCVCNSI